jgi:hypothetical protein
LGGLAKADIFVGQNNLGSSNLLSGIIKATSFTITAKDGNDSFNKVRPSETTPIFINGGQPIPPASPGDQLSTLTVPGATITFDYDPVTGNGSIDYGVVRKKITFTSIESVVGLSISAQATQIADNVALIRVVGTLNGQPTGKVINEQPPTAPPFLVAPALVDPTQPFKAPSLAVGDVNGDGIPDLIVGAGPNSGGPLVSIISGKRFLFAANSNANTRDFLIAQFFAYDPTFFGGVFVAAADILPDPVGNRVEIITGAAQNGGPHVKVFQVTGNGPFKVNAGPQFFAYGAGFHGGVRVSAGDVNKDGVPDIVTGAGPGGGPHVRIFDGKSIRMGGQQVVGEFFAYDAGFRGGVFVDVGDAADGVNSFKRDGFADIATGAGFGGGPHIRVFDGKKISQGALQVDTEFFDAFDVVAGPTPFQENTTALTAGVNGVGFNDIDGDGLLELFVGSGLGRRSRFRVYKMGNFTPVLEQELAAQRFGVNVATSGGNLVI